MGQTKVEKLEALLGTLQQEANKLAESILGLEQKLSAVTTE